MALVVVKISLKFARSFLLLHLMHRILNKAALDKSEAYMHV